MKKDFSNLDPDSISAFLRLLVTGSEFLDSLDRVLSGYDITHGRWLTLLLLRRREIWHALPSELAQEQGITRATMSGLLRQLERQDLISRQEVPEDGRRTIIVLTETGADLVNRIMPRYYELIDELMAPLNPEEKKTLKVLLDKLLIN